MTGYQSHQDGLEFGTRPSCVEHVITVLRRTAARALEREKKQKSPHMWTYERFCNFVLQIFGI